MKYLININQNTIAIFFGRQEMPEKLKNVFSTNLHITNFRLNKKSISIGDDLYYSFELKVGGEKNSKVRLEYGVDYMKSSGKQSRKVFKITENEYSPGRYNFEKKHSFSDLSTRKHYAGKHGLSIIVNGEEKVYLELDLLV